MTNPVRTRLCAVLLALSSAAHAQDFKALEASAEAAYDAKDYAASALLYDQAAAGGVHSRSFYYNAACSNALAGRHDRAFELLGLAVENGFSNVSGLGSDPDLASLRGDPRWTSLPERIRRLHPEALYLEMLMDQRRSAAERYFPTHAAFAAGLVAPSRETSPFEEFYATAATMLGEYDEARRHYAKPSEADPVATGHVRAEPANGRIVTMAKGRDVVLLNESHGEVQTRAALYTLLAPLRAAGFTHLALEALTAPNPEPAGEAACSAPLLHDSALATRGYPVPSTGYYTSEPVYGELLREAVRLGFQLVSYDGGGNAGDREAHQARKIACIRERDRSARIVVIGGFNHVSKQPDLFYPGGMMGARLGRLIGSEPLSVDLVGLLSIDPATLEFPADDVGAQAFALVDAQGRPFARKGYDISLTMKGPAQRGVAAGTWLGLGGVRQAFPVDREACAAHLPCVVQGRGATETADAVAEDSCVVHTDASAGCSLYLRPGAHVLMVRDTTGRVVSEKAITVSAPTAPRR